MSNTLDANPQIAAIVHADLVRGVRANTGSEGLSGDQVLRAAILYHSNGWSFEALAFELRYHAAYRWFCALDHDQFPSKSALHRDIRRIEPETWESIQGSILRHAQELGIEDGKQVRTDCTVVETNIHEPSDSSLLWDCVRELTRQLKNASELVSVVYSDHSKRAKRKAWAIRNAKRQNQRVPLYRDLVKVTKKTIGYARRSVQALRYRKHPLATGCADAMQHMIDEAARRTLWATRRAGCF